MITLIMIGYALLFSATRREKAVLLLPFGFMMGLAASLKPTAAPFGLFLLLLAAQYLRKKGIRARSYIVYGLSGLVLALLINLEFLYRYHAFGDFVEISRRLTPYYASIANSSLHVLFHNLIPGPYRLLLLAGCVLTFINGKGKDWESGERVALVMGILFGALSFIVQRKDFEHHAYSFIVFILLWSAIEFAKSWQKRGWAHAAGLVCFSVGVFVVVPSLISTVASTSPRNELPDALKSDLNRLGGSSLQHQVQCFDMVESCYGTLYRLKLLPYSAVMGDYMFFGAPGSSPLPYYQNSIWTEFQKNPPRIVVVTNEWLGGVFSFDKLNQWPQMVQFLDSAYSLEVARSSGVFAYRIYLLKPKGRN